MFYPIVTNDLVKDQQKLAQEKAQHFRDVMIAFEWRDICLQRRKTQLGYLRWQVQILLMRLIFA